ncbi:hypothetical protein M0804_001957 [Polistes exclamans]|nr:hypothetical protein M0804_001957 [Polistes exclamans]
MCFYRCCCCFCNFGNYDDDDEKLDEVRVLRPARNPKTGAGNFEAKANGRFRTAAMPAIRICIAYRQRATDRDNNRMVHGAVFVVHGRL